MDWGNHIKVKSNQNVEHKTNWIREENRGKFMTFYWFYVVTRLIINQILQCIYLILQKQSTTQDKDPKSELEIQNNLKLIQKLMIFVGQIHRADGATGVFFYALTISVVLTFNLIRIISGGRIFDVLSGNRMLLFLAKPELEEEIVRQNINAILDKLICSNKNFARQFVRHLIENDEVILSEKGDRNSACEFKFTNEHYSQNSIKYSIKDMNILRQRNEANEFYDLVTEVELIEGLYKQRQYLIKLKTNPANIWPPTRNEVWFYKLRNFGAHSYIQASIYSWIFGQIGASISFYLGYHTIRDTTSFGAEYRKFTLNERLLCAEYHFFTLMFMFSFIPLFTTYLLYLLYQLVHLRALKPRLQSIYESVKRCELWLYNSDKCLRNNFRLIEETRKDLQFECDKRVLELYINYQIFRDEIKLAIKIANTAANQIVSFLILSLLPNLAFYGYVPRAHIPTLIFVGLTIIMAANIPFLFCAFLTASCIRFANSAWSLIAFADGHNYCLYQYSKNRRSNMGLYKKNRDISRDQGEVSLLFLNQDQHQLQKPEGRVIPDYGYFSKSFISPHTILLWRRLVEHHETVTNDFVCKLFGIFRINYHGILKFNHWGRVTSIVKHVKDLMLIFGQIHRAGGAIGIFYYSVCFGAMMTFFFFGLISSQHMFDHYNKNRFISFLKDHEKENERISRKIDEFIEKTLNSNLNFRVATTGQLNCNQQQSYCNCKYTDQFKANTSKSVSSDSIHSVSSAPTTAAKNVQTNQILSINSVQRKPFLDRSMNVFIESDEWQHKDLKNVSPPERYLLNALSMQLKHLNSLKCIKGRIWLANRFPQSISRWKQMWLEVYLTTTIVIYVFGQLCCVFGYKMAEISLLDSHLEEEYRRFTLMDRLTLIDYHIFSYLVADIFITPALVLAFSILDQKKNITSIKDKLCRLCEKMRRYEVPQHQQREFRSQIPSAYNYNLNLKLIRQEQSDLQFECDKEASELYLLYQIIHDEISSVVKVAECVTNQFGIFLIMSIIPTLIFFVDVKIQGTSLLFIVIAMISIVINALLLMCAALHASSAHLSNHVQAFVSFAEGHNYQMYCNSKRATLRAGLFHSSSYHHSSIPSSPVVSREYYSNSSRNITEGNQKGSDQARTMLDLDFDYYSHGYITPHTILLWRRLTVNHNIFEDNSVCKLFNIYKLTYCGILRLNYWFVSLALFSFTYKSSS